MITKEQARSIFNIYSQIDTSTKIIEELENFVKECDNNVPDVIDENYSMYIELAIPYFESGKFKKGGARVFNINYSQAIKVLKSQRRMLKKRLEKLNNEVVESQL